MKKAPILDVDRRFTLPLNYLASFFTTWRPS